MTQSIFPKHESRLTNHNGARVVKYLFSGQFSSTSVCSFDYIIPLISNCPTYLIFTKIYGIKIPRMHFGFHGNSILRFYQCYFPTSAFCFVKQFLLHIINTRQLQKLGTHDKAF
jgi:hypothetical protein